VETLRVGSGSGFGFVIDSNPGTRRLTPAESLPCPAKPFPARKSDRCRKTKSPATPYKHAGNKLTEVYLGSRAQQHDRPGWVRCRQLHSRPPPDAHRPTTTNKATLATLCMTRRHRLSSKAYTGHTSGPLSGPKPHRYGSLTTRRADAHRRQWAVRQYGDPHLRRCGPER